MRGVPSQPYWQADGSFWYAEGAPGTNDILAVDPRRNLVHPLIDATRLRAALSGFLGREPPGPQPPFADVGALGRGELRLQLEGHDLVVALGTYRVSAPTASELAVRARSAPRLVRKGRLAGFPDVLELPSPDGRWLAGIVEHDLRLRSTQEDRSIALTDDGTADGAWDLEDARWSPDSARLALYRVERGRAPQIPLVRYLRPLEEVEWVVHPRAGQPIPAWKLHVVDVASRRLVAVDTGPGDAYPIILNWSRDGSTLYSLRLQRDQKRHELRAVDSRTGSSRTLIEETRETFVLGWDAPDFTPLSDGRRFVWVSERDGWKHVYLHEVTGRLIRQLTGGPFPAERVVAVDERSRWVYYTAHEEAKRPYDTHLYRVRLEGGPRERLTEAPGQHSISMSPGLDFFVDRHSAIDRPPVAELRRADGTLLRTLARTDITDLVAHGWRPPEEFVARAADGETDLRGVLYKPDDFDASRKYPVLEYIYGGPQESIVPRSFAERGPSWLGFPFTQAMAQLGFVVFVVDARGTPGRGKAFQDVVYGSFGRHEISDHAAALRHLAATRPFMDLDRVGIFGWSWGGYMALRALLLEPGLYSAAVAGAPGPDPIDDGHWIETFMGLPESNPEGYANGSNLRLLEKLRGRLLLIHGTADVNVPLASTLKISDGLIRAGLPFDLLLLPDQDHMLSESGRSYVRDAVRRFFRERLGAECDPSRAQAP